MIARTTQMKVSAAVWALGLFTISTLVTQSANAELRIVTTLPDLAALAKEVGGEHVKVEAMVRSSEDPHYVDPKPNLLLKLNKADMLILNGLELEVGWLPPLIKQARNTKIARGSAGYLDVSAFVHKREVPAVVDRGQGDVHPGGNPHFTFDPRAAVNITRAIARQLGAIDPDNASHYSRRADVFSAELHELGRRQTERFAKLPSAKRRVVVYHQSLTYLLDWLNIDRVTTVEPKPGIAPSPGHVATVLKTMRGEGVRVILQEEFYPQKTSKTLARMANGEVVVLNGGTRFRSGESYTKHIEDVAEKIYAALQKQ